MKRRDFQSWRLGRKGNRNELAEASTAFHILSMSKPFREVQYALRWWLALLLLVPVSAVGYGLFQQFVLGKRWGNRPVSNVAFGLIGALLFGFVAWIFSLHLATEVRDGQLILSWRYLWLPRRIPLDEIEKAEAVRYSPVGEYMGWGIRRSITDGSICYTARGDRGVRVATKDGKKLLVGSQRPEELVAALL